MPVIANSSDWGAASISEDPVAILLLVLGGCALVALVVYFFRSVLFRHSEGSILDRICAFLTWSSISAVAIGLAVLRFAGLSTLTDKLFFPVVFFSVAIGIGGSGIHFGRPVPGGKRASS